MFTLNQMVAEYRALRGSVVRRWTEQMREPGREALEELTRFNEAMDESLTKAIESYSTRLEEARDLYAGALAHDLRNPLSAILTAAQGLAVAADTEGATEPVTGQILRSGQRMKLMIDDLLDFTRTRLGGGLPLHLARQDMVSLARQVAEELKGGDPQCHLRLDLPETLRGVWDGVRVQQMLSNLMGNAVRYCAPGAAVRNRPPACVRAASLSPGCASGRWPRDFSLSSCGVWAVRIFSASVESTCAA